MTLAADAGARFLFTARQMPWKRAKAAEQWKTMKPAEKYRYRGNSGELVLASLAALPERAVPGEKPTFTQAEIIEAARAGAQATMDRQAPGTWDSLGAKKQSRLAALSMLLTRAAVAALPARANLEAPPSVPDFIPDDLL